MFFAGPVHHGRRPGQRRRHRLSSATPSTAVGGDYFLLAATGLLFGSAVLSGDRRQHPLRRHHVPARRRPGRQPGGDPQEQSLWWALALGRRPRRQRHRHRRQRQRGHHRHRQTQRPPDLVLDLHPLRTGRHRRHRSASASPTSPCATSSWPDRGFLAIPHSPSRAKSTASASSCLPQVPVGGGDRHPLAEGPAGGGERLADDRPR